MEETKGRYGFLRIIQSISKLRKHTLKFVKQHTTARVDNKQVATINFKAIAT